LTFGFGISSTYIGYDFCERGGMQTRFSGAVQSLQYEKSRTRSEFALGEPREDAAELFVAANSAFIADLYPKELLSTRAIEKTFLYGAIT
jgi:hypothetical protein